MKAAGYVQLKNKVRGRTELLGLLEDQGFRLLKFLTDKWIPFPKKFFAQMEQRVFVGEGSPDRPHYPLIVFSMPVV